MSKENTKDYKALYEWATKENERLNDIYSRLSTAIMDLIRDDIRNIAETVCDEKMDEHEKYNIHERSGHYY